MKVSEEGKSFEIMMLQNQQEYNKVSYQVFFLERIQMFILLLVKFLNYEFSYFIYFFLNKQELC